MKSHKRKNIQNQDVSKIFKKKKSLDTSKLEVIKEVKPENTDNLDLVMSDVAKSSMSLESIKEMLKVRYSAKKFEKIREFLAAEGRSAHDIENILMKVCITSFLIFHYIA